MKRLLKGEVKTQFNTRGILILLIVLIITTIFSLKEYNDIYSNLFQVQLEKSKGYSDESYDTYLYLDDLSMDIKNQINEMKNSNGSQEDIKELEEEVKNVDIEKNVIINMQFYYSNMASAFSKNVNDEDADIDANFIEALKIGNKINSMVFKEIYEKGIEPKSKSLLYRNDAEDLYKRLVTVKTKVSLNEKSNIEATGLSMLDFRMSSQVSYLIILIVILLNYNIWSKEFELGHIKTLITQPYKKNKIYIARLIISMTKTILVVLLIFSLPIIITTIKNTWGEPTARIINSLVQNTIFTISGNKEIFLYIVGVDSIKYASYYMPIFFTYIIFLMSGIHFVSIIFKSDFGSIVGFVPVLSLMFLENPYNPFCYFRIQSLLLGEIGIGFRGAMIIMAVFIVVFNIGAYLLFDRYEDK